MGFRVTTPEKIKAIRGARTIDEIVENANHKFTRGNLSAWENGHWKPSDKNIPVLINALGCTFEDISSPLDEEEK